MTWHERVAELPAWAPPPVEAALVVVAHPDDETLALAGTVGALHAAGTTVDLLVLTDGEAFLPPGTRDPARLAAQRRGEGTAAWAALGAPRPPSFAGLPDGALPEHRDDVDAAVRDAVHRTAPGLVVGLWSHDPHRDHAEAGRSAAAVAREHDLPFVAAPLWARAWYTPRHPRIRWETARRVPHDDVTRTRRDLALACYPSQTAPFDGHPPVVDAETLAALAGDDVLVVS
ncbi:hypothetical protein GCM10027194_03650 [Thalassiella azotivora]